MSASNSPVPTNTNTEPKHWLIRIGDGENFALSLKNNIWGISSKNTLYQYFIKNVKHDDKLWFIKNKSHGQAIAVATYLSHKIRKDGNLSDISLTDDEISWSRNGKEWESCDTEVYYTDLYGLQNCELYTNIVSPLIIREYNEKCQVNLPLEYKYITCSF